MEAFDLSKNSTKEFYRVFCKKLFNKYFRIAIPVAVLFSVYTIYNKGSVNAILCVLVIATLIVCLFLPFAKLEVLRDVEYKFCTPGWKSKFKYILCYLLLMVPLLIVAMAIAIVSVTTI